MLLDEFLVSVRHLGQEEMSTEKYNEEKEEKSIKLEDACGFILASEAKSCEIRQRFGD
jgi:hypothetical protein